MVKTVILPDNPSPIINVIIPALNEEAVIGDVVSSLPLDPSNIIVVDNGSVDETANVARKAGAQVIHVPIAGYGRACLAGIEQASEANIIVFMDGDGADDPADFSKIIEPIITGRADLVIGSRLSGDVDQGALTLPQQMGNRLACFFMRHLWHGEFTDLGPFRAIRCSSLTQLNMSAKTYGWTVEMQTRALKLGLRCEEVPVHYLSLIHI